MTEEQALREALKYIADCLEKDEMYSVSMDEFVRGDSMKSQLVMFARRIAAGSPRWRQWCEMKGKAKA